MTVKTHPCPTCGQAMIQKNVLLNHCSASAEYTDSPCPGEEPTTHTPIEGVETEDNIDVWYCPQCTITD